MHHLPETAQRIGDLVPEPSATWLVGGAVRDTILGRSVEDLDLAVPQGALALVDLLAERLGGTPVVLDRPRGCGRVVLPGGTEIDVADFRAPTLEEDLAARDLTINSMALSLGPEPRLVDPLGGRRDLEEEIVRLTGESALRDDPLRALRVVRFASALGFSVADETRELVRRRADDLATAAPERIADELFAALGGKRPAEAIRDLGDLRLLGATLPEIRSDVRGAADRVAAVVSTLDAVAEDLRRRSEADLVAELAAHLDRPIAGKRPRRTLILAVAALAPAGADATRKRFEKLRLSTAESQWVGAVLGRLDEARDLLGAEATPDRRSLHRFFRDAEDAALDAALLGVALREAANGSPVETPLSRLGTLVETATLRRREIVDPPLPMGGGELVSELGISPGPAVGRILRELREEVAAGSVGSRSEALAFARERARAGDSG